ncbi:hypothetical protein TA3x_003516 [Tundrisphaera sp. TA3]|uniref:hypothetical protein n=1 Tax=Tundrisphaera sp. TA3 TaxID=3435775 RepID=UPI003EBADBAA
MEFEQDFLYRGTTDGWPGTDANQTLPMTCTSTDPYIATCFALECSSRGQAILQMVKRQTVAVIIGKSNFFDPSEKAVNLKITPLNFTSLVEYSLPAQEARSILVELGFDRVPYLINGLGVLFDEIKRYSESGNELSAFQRREFNRAAIGENP